MLSFNDAYIFGGCLNFEDADKVVQHLNAMDNLPTALVVTNDQVVAGIVICSLNEGIKVPEDLAIIGFDNQPIAKYLGIATLEIPLLDLGRQLYF